MEPSSPGTYAARGEELIADCALSFRSSKNLGIVGRLWYVSRKAQACVRSDLVSMTSPFMGTTRFGGPGNTIRGIVANSQ